MSLEIRSIDVTVPTDSEYYGTAATSEDALMVAKNLLAVGVAVLQREFPDADVSGRLVPETSSYNNQTSIEIAGDPPEMRDEETAEALVDNRMEMVFASDCIWGHELTDAEVAEAAADLSEPATAREEESADERS